MQISPTEYVPYLPECTYICPDDPFNDDRFYNQTWTPGDKGIGSFANYTCLGMITCLFVFNRS